MKEIKIWKMILLYFGTVMGVSIAYAIYGVIRYGNSDISINMCILSVFLEGLLLFVILIAGRVNLTLVKERYSDFKNKVNIKEIVIVVITQLALSIGLSNLITWILSKINIEFTLKLLNDSDGNPTNTIELILLLITIVIIAPIFEEIVFRRVLYKRLAIRLKFIGATLISSFVFGMMHGALGIAGAIAFGISCCILYKKYNNILITMAVHIINNLIAGIGLAISYYNGSLNEKVTNISNGDSTMFLVSGIVLTIISGIVFIRFIINNKKVIKGIDENKILM